MYEREKEKLDSINFNIESQIFSIESMGLIIETAETLKDTSIHMKSINSNLDIDKIESPMEELQENRDIGEELQSIFSESINMVFDEDDLLNELKELDNNEEEENIDVNVPKTSIKPTIKITENNNNIQLPISHNKPIIVENALINKSENKVENTPAPLLAS